MSKLDFVTIMGMSCGFILGVFLIVFLCFYESLFFAGVFIGVALWPLCYGMMLNFENYLGDKHGKND